MDDRDVNVMAGQVFKEAPAGMHSAYTSSHLQQSQDSLTSLQRNRLSSLFKARGLETPPQIRENDRVRSVLACL